MISAIVMTSHLMEEFNAKMVYDTPKDVYLYPSNTSWLDYDVTPNG